MKRSSRALLPLLCAALWTAPALWPTAWAAGGAGAPTLPASRLEMAMTLYAGGITMGKMDLDATFRGGDYQAVSHLQTSGLINAFWQSEIQATASGKLGAKGLAPVLYDSFDSRAGRRREVSLSYDGQQPPRLYADPPYDTTGFEVKPDDTKNTLDPLSALTFILSGVGATGGDPFALIAPVFDGRRRYNVEMSKVRDLEIRMDNGFYQGKGVECVLRYRQIAGFRPRVLKANESFPVIHAWLALFPSAVAGRSYALPLRLWADTKYGVLAILTTGLKVDGTVPKGVKS